MISRFALASIVAACCGGLTEAQTTRTYEYDALGRLVKVTPSSGNAVCYTLDTADNRTAVVVGGSCAGAGGGSNSPPTAVADSLAALVFDTWAYEFFDVLVNDTDPDLPNDTLTVTAVTGSSYVTASTAGLFFMGPPGEYTVTYTIQDSFGASSSTTAQLFIIYCNPLGC